MENVEMVNEMMNEDTIEAVTEMAPKGKAGVILGIATGALALVGVVVAAVKKIQAKRAEEAERDVFDAVYEDSDDEDDSEDVD